MSLLANCRSQLLDRLGKRACVCMYVYVRTHVAHVRVYMRTYVCAFVRACVHVYEIFDLNSTLMVSLDRRHVNSVTTTPCYAELLVICSRFMSIPFNLF